MASRKRPPTVRQLLGTLNKVRVRCINKFKTDPSQTGEWRPDETDSDLEGIIVIATKIDAKRGVDGLLTYALHELVHAYFQVNCNDNRAHHDKIYRWESLLFRSRALREAMAIRVGNAYIYGQEEP